MFRFRGVPMPGFALATLAGILLLAIGPLFELTTMSLGLAILSCWVVTDLLAMSAVLKDPSPTVPEQTPMVAESQAEESSGTEPGPESPETDP